MASLFEPEEIVGRIWHRLVGGTSSYPRHPQAAVRLDEMRTRLGVMFRALGGPGGVRLGRGAAERFQPPAGPLQRLGLGTEKLDAPATTAPRCNCRPASTASRARGQRGALRVAGRLVRPRRAHAVVRPTRCRPTSRACARRAPRRRVALTPIGRACGALHERLCRALPRTSGPGAAAPARRRRSRRLVVALLGGRRRSGPGLLPAIADPAVPLDRFRAGRGYQPFLPVPLWGEVVDPGAAQHAAEGGRGGRRRRRRSDGKRRKAPRRARTTRPSRDDPLHAEPLRDHPRPGGDGQPQPRGRGRRRGRRPQGRRGPGRDRASASTSARPRPG